MGGLCREAQYREVDDDTVTRNTVKLYDGRNEKKNRIQTGETKKRTVLKIKKVTAAYRAVTLGRVIG